jgi:hypothetical protein
MDEWMQMSDDHLGRTLSTLATELAYPKTPSMASAVTARLGAERVAGRRPPFPAAALWSRRRVVVFLAVGLLATLAVAAAARYAIGSFAVRVQPGVTPGPSTPPFEPDVLGEPVAPDVAVALAGFDAALPAGPAPDETYVVDSLFGDPGLVFAWTPNAAYPTIPGTEWGLVLVAAQGETETVVKTIGRFEDLEEIRVNGERAFWIPVPHILSLQTDRGVQAYSVEGNVLIWRGPDGLAYRLETSLDRGDAIAIAESAA